MMKKLIMTALSSMFVLGTAAACGNEGTENNEVNGENVTNNNVEENQPSLNEDDETEEGLNDPLENETENNVDEN